MSRAVWIETWMPIPASVGECAFVSNRLMRGMQQASSSRSTLGEIEHDFQSHDIVLVCAAIFMLLHHGRVKAAALRERALDSRLFFGVCGDEQVAK